MSNKVLLTKIKKGAFQLTLMHPEKRNALSFELIDDMIEAWQSLTQDTRLVLIRGDQKAFSSGLDRTILSCHKSDISLLSQKIGELLALIHQSPFCVISVVEGAAVGGGVGLALACDLVILSSQASMRLPEWTLGVFPEQIWPYLEKRVKHHIVLKALLSGNSMEASHLLKDGWVDDVVPHNMLSEFLDESITRILSYPNSLIERYKLLTNIASNTSNCAQLFMDEIN
ncbi:MAG: enoyl-CoA hydratase/isomerase family protein [Candidatus Comchoanobacterales bacterium]